MDFFEWVVSVIGLTAIMMVVVQVHLRRMAARRRLFEEALDQIRAELRKNEAEEVLREFVRGQAFQEAMADALRQPTPLQQKLAKLSPEKRTRAEHIIQLIERGATPGERAAAQAALHRLLAAA
jgi:hypothetical protein